MAGDSLNDDCPICLQTLSTGGFNQASGHLAGFTPDAEAIWHCYHQACLAQWTANHGNCPVCNEGIALAAWSHNIALH
jgi:hypothetical protein